ncbi:GNAT family N-acetyltransferase [Burkholderia alba]|uniref:GNAT family N-acetyltransferase n=1 Tax=Burkholderia alba TaxID=2683677 RepID=UPI002B05A14A|nr:GNAT family N-acetyltransferase [Burkholderia alba]
MTDLRLLEPADASAFRALRLIAIDTSPTAVWPTRAEEEAASLAQLEARITATPMQAVLGAWIDGALVGFTGVRKEPFEQVSHRVWIWGVFVDPAQRGKGLARRLVERSIEHAVREWGVIQVKLCVNTENAPAMALYASLGFETFGIERRSMKVAGRFDDEAHMVRMLD